MIEFFRDKLDGPLYIVIAIISLFFIVAIIGFIMERKKLEKEEQEKIAHIDIKKEEPQPIEPVTVESNNININEEINPVIKQEDELVLNTPTIEENKEENIENPIEEVQENDDVYVKPQVIVFEDPDDKKE